MPTLTATVRLLACSIAAAAALAIHPSAALAAPTTPAATAPAAPVAAATKPAVVAAPATPAAPTAASVDANRATQAELESLRGVGPSLAGKIVAERQKGAFRDWPDLIARVAGVGEKSAMKLSAAGLQVAGAGYVPSATPSPSPAKATVAAKKPA